MVKSTSFLFGSLFGLNSLPEALAVGENETNSFFRPRIALIIDDIGFTFSRARQFLELGVPITFSILPRLGNSHDLALEIHSEGQEIMLHQPMEPHNPELNPGPGALYVGYGAERIVRIVEENISSFPFAIGVNNHMGSKFTECGREMSEALGVIKKRGFFFIDSLTTSRSKAFKVARKLNMVTASRNIFLDNRREETAILFQLNKLKSHAYKCGHAIGIGHPFPETARAISQFVRGLKDSGITLVHASRLVHT